MGRTRLEPDERRDRLLRLGRQLFAESAYHEVTMAGIARAAEVSTGLVYHYFAGKRGYYIATIEDAVEELIEALTPDTALEFLPALEGSLDRFLGFVAANARLYRGLVRGGIGTDAEVAAIVERVRAAAVESAAQQLRWPEPDARQAHLLYGWVGAIESMALRWSVVQDLELPALRGLMIEALQPLLTGPATGNR